MESTQLVVLVDVAVVLVIGVVSFVSVRIGVAALLALTVVGVGVGATANHFVLEPDVVLTVILPPPLYAAARQVPFVGFRRNLRVIGFLVIVLIVVSAVLVGVAVWLIWAVPIALGAVVAPPDAVAATSLGKRLGLPPRVVTILESEGLVNDASALS